MKKYKNIISNFLSLSIVQGVNYVLPLLTFPYLVRVLGVENFGLVAFAQSVIQIFILFSDYGFNLSATKQISLNRNESKKVSNIFSSVITIKLLLTAIGFFILAFIVLTIRKFNENWDIYLLTYLMVLGNALFPVWLFQGLEKMKYITIINIISKSISTLFIFLLVKSSHDVIILTLINSLSSLVAGFLAIVITMKKLKVVFNRPLIEEVRLQLKDGWHVFISLISTSAYTSVGVIILGVFYNSTVVGYFAAVDKILNAVKGLYQPLSQAIFPYINALVQKSVKDTIFFLKKLTIIVAFFEIIICMMLFFFAEFIIIKLFGYHMIKSADILRIMAFVPLIGALSNIVGSQTLLPFNLKKLFSMSIIIPSITHMILVLILVPKFGSLILAITIVFTELFILMYRTIGWGKIYRKTFWERVYEIQGK